MGTLHIYKAMIIPGSLKDAFELVLLNKYLKARGLKTKRNYVAKLRRREDDKTVERKNNFCNSFATIISLVTNVKLKYVFVI
jgi:hypothetical protein